MLTEAKKDLITYARQLARPYESYSIDELANAYCAAKATNNESHKNIYGSALMLRFWYQILKLQASNSGVKCWDLTDHFGTVYDGIELACTYKGWQDPTKNLNAQQCINKCINTILLRKLYDLRLDKNKTVNYCTSLETPVCGGEGDNSTKTLGDVIESPNGIDESSTDISLLVQNYINRNKIIEAILIDNIAFNDAQKYSKKTVKTTNADGEPYSYTEYSSEFWPYRLVQLVSKLPDTYKSYFMTRYKISEDKLSTVLNVIDKTPNQKLYKYLKSTLNELRASYT